MRFILKAYYSHILPRSAAVRYWSFTTETRFDTGPVLEGFVVDGEVLGQSFHPVPGVSIPLVVLTAISLTFPRRCVMSPIDSSVDKTVLCPGTL